MTRRPDVAGAPADFGTRFSAFTIDAVILIGGLWIVFFVLSRQLQAMGLSETEPCSLESPVLCEGPSTPAWVVLTILVLVLLIGYHAFFEGLRGATPGKYWMGLRVVGTDGEMPIGLGPGIVRSIDRQLFWLSLFIVLDISPVSIDVPPAVFIGLPGACLASLALGAVLPSGRAGHDFVAGTVVVHTPADDAVSDAPAEHMSREPL